MRRRSDAYRSISRSYAVRRPKPGMHPIARLLVALALLAGAVWVAGAFGAMALERGWFESLDRYAVRAAADHPLTVFYLWVTWLGTRTGFIVVSAVMLLVLLSLRMYRGAGALVLSLLSAAWTNDFIKEWVARERPVSEILEGVEGFSYLSGHAFVAAAVYGLFGYVLARRAKGLLFKGVIAAVTLVAVFLVGYSRIYLNVHYASDVAGGFLLGLVWLCVWVWLFRPHAQS